jgi:hypothetical protein
MAWFRKPSKLLSQRGFPIVDYFRFARNPGLRCEVEWKVRLFRYLSRRSESKIRVRVSDEGLASWGRPLYLPKSVRPFG